MNILFIVPHQTFPVNLLFAEPLRQ